MTKRRVLLTCLVLFTLLSGVVVCARDVYKFHIPKYDEPIYGTWINPKYDGSGGWKTAQKLIFSNWGNAEWFEKVGDETPFSRLTFILVEKWTDAKGNTWYKEFSQYPAGKDYLLCRISKDGKTLEQIYRSAGFPAETDMGSGHPNYWIYFRK